MRGAFVDSIYEAAGNAEKWGGVLKTLSAQTGGVDGLYFLKDRQQGQYRQFMPVGIRQRLSCPMGATTAPSTPMRHW
jgi:hypothetical protein